MPDINWGEDETVAKFSSRYDESSGNLILAEDNDSNTVLLEWDGTTWQYRGPVEMNGEDVSGVGTLTATNVVADSVSTKQSKVTGEDSISISVPSDYPTLPEAVYAASHVVPNIDRLVSINIESGFSISNRVTLERANYRHISITSEDTTVPVDGSVTSPDFDGVFDFVDCVAPTIAVSLDFQGNGDIGSCLTYRRSVGYIDPSVSIENSGGRGITITDGSLLRAREITVSNHNRAVSVNRASGAFLRLSNLTESTERNLRVSPQCHANANGATLTGAGEWSVFAQNSTVDLIDADVSESDRGVIGQNAVVRADNLTASNINDIGIKATNSAIISAENAILDTVDGATNNRAIEVNSSRLTATDISVTNSGGSVEVSNRGDATFNGGSIQTSNGTEVIVLTGGTMELSDCETSSSTGGDPHESDLNISPNSLTSDGIIFAGSTET